jgi:enoyl-CoA hydratase/carnithine racemase
MSDIFIRKTGCAGRITLTRPKALNAMSYDMCMAIDAALDQWQDDDDVSVIVIDAEGDRAFCAGGDIQELYDTGRAGDFEYGRKFWADEYRLNAKIFHYPKPYVAFMQGFTMGGGVGISCHGSHRIVGETSQIAMPECGIGLVPDVGGSLLLSQAPGRLGEYLGTTTQRMGPADAIHAGFADYYIAENLWQGLIAELEKTGNISLIDEKSQPLPDSELARQQPLIDRYFAGETLADIVRLLRLESSEFTDRALKAIGRSSPLSAACTVEMMHRLRGSDDIEKALDLEYRFTYRAAETGDFLEGIRAAIIDKDRNPNWQHDGPDTVSLADISKMLRPLGAHALKLEG